MILKKVRVYWNLHSKIWSVQDSKSGLVIDHVSHISLEDAKFIVRKGGQERVRRGWTETCSWGGQEKCTCLCRGYITPLGDKYKDKTFKWYRVTYNPYKNDYFMLGKYEIERDWIGNIHMESMVHEHGVASRVYV